MYMYHGFSVTIQKQEKHWMWYRPLSSTSDDINLQSFPVILGQIFCYAFDVMLCNFKYITLTYTMPYYAML